MKTPTSSKKRQAKKAAQAKLSGFAVSTDDAPKNKKIVFDDSDGDEDSVDEVGDRGDDDNVPQDGIGILNAEEDGSGGIDGNDDGSQSEDGAHEATSGNVEEHDDDEDDDAVEEVKGSKAREATKKLRDQERKVAKENAKAQTKKKRNKTTQDEKNNKEGQVEDGNEISDGSDAEEEDEEGKIFDDDFFKQVDSERAEHLLKSKEERKKQKSELKMRLGRHTTFVVEDEYKMIDAPKSMNQNIDVIALGGGKNGDSDEVDNDGTDDDEERQIIISASLGTAPSKSAIVFARGKLVSGTSKERSCPSRKRKSKNEETWKRSRRMNAKPRPGFAAAMFVRKS
mmetsp:Transcript_9820/g.19338  ORF Transcript_9820/g.19338 Transcript_9820/m.19338 type:complete len:340 (-) Transcript_9820:37-1056(-)|eukprot:CAMPEP_0171334428 /NCGR_PEP_ID=MMETSP0878-20121228/4640_1 /TAXON_ID=67004 /ORGANISM="Thalassiosira weissflogii, Strain CCMP1336" /LENGTH=339 /DNA_ID=CAMNT_0011835503 /DNA_START=119 /DNA_END=1138 /DNA_ORIENTATION=+